MITWYILVFQIKTLVYFNNKHNQKMGCKTHATSISFFEIKTLQLYNLQALLIYQYIVTW